MTPFKLSRYWLKASATLSIASMLILGQAVVAHAQRTASLSAEPFLTHVVDSQGNTLTLASDPTTELYRRGTDPLAKLTRADGTTPVTLDDFDDVSGHFTLIEKLDGTGTVVEAEVEGLLPGEEYSFWAGYWPPPGFPQGSHLAFGAITTAGDGSDNWQVADAEGKISKTLTQLAGPMTLDGEASAYAPETPIVDLNGETAFHAGYSIGLAFHFGDFPQPPTPVPGPANTWALHTAPTFAPVPEPSSLSFALLGCVMVMLRHRHARRA